MPRSEETADYKQWLIPEFEQMVVEGVSRVIDLGGGERVMQEFVRVFPLSSYCDDFGVDLLPIFFLGPDIEDLSHVVQIMRTGALRSSRILLVTNEGVIRARETAEGAFNPMFAHPDFKALMKDGAKSVMLRKLHCLDLLRARRFGFYDAAYAAGTPGGSATATGQFSVANGQIIGPDGTPFIARGINTFLGQADAATILKTFPGINAVRLATTPGADPNAIDSLVQGLTSKGVVVVIEDHSSSGGNPNTLGGDVLNAETKWYAGLAGKYQANPLVWFGTANEPDNRANPKAITDQERAIYDAIRGTGSKAMVLLEERGGG